MGNEQGEHKVLFDADLGARIAVMVQDEVAKSLEGLDIETMIRAEIEKATAKIEYRIGKATHHMHKDTGRTQEHALRVQERAERAQERAKRAADRASRLAERQAHGINVTLDVKRNRDVAPNVSQEEQLSILEMLQSGTITPEQAEMLLNALET